METITANEISNEQRLEILKHKLMRTITISELSNEQRLEILKNDNKNHYNLLNTTILDGMDINFIEKYLRKRKLLEINEKNCNI